MAHINDASDVTAKELKLACKMFLRIEWAIWDMEEVIKELFRDCAKGVEPTGFAKRYYDCYCIVCGLHFGDATFPVFSTNCYRCRGHAETMIHWVISKIALHTGLHQSIVREYMAFSYAELSEDHKRNRYDNLVRRYAAPKLETLISQFRATAERVPEKVSDLQTQGQVGQDSNQ